MNYKRCKSWYLIMCCMATHGELLCICTLPYVLFSLLPCYHLPWNFRPLVLQLCCKYLTSHLSVFSCWAFSSSHKSQLGRQQVIELWSAMGSCQNCAAQHWPSVGHTPTEDVTSVAGSRQREISSALLKRTTVALQPACIGEGLVKQGRGWSTLGAWPWRLVTLAFKICSPQIKNVQYFQPFRYI